jgi:hypothetical protein
MKEMKPAIQTESYLKIELRYFRVRRASNKTTQIFYVRNLYSVNIVQKLQYKENIIYVRGIFKRKFTKSNRFACSGKLNMKIPD